MAETAKRPRGRPKKAKQQWIEGTAPPSIPAIDQAAETYIEVRDERAALSKQEAEAQTALEAVMRDNQLTRYEYDGKIVIASSTTKIAVKRKKDKPKGGNGEAD